ncbi:DUF6612 family protein [Salibacterium qingdaonense]|uniref:Uncharacterized protein n=1 Tax=Salibacterium qingdaonense TaxID=266892 RepID=A0A1I4KY76_9BACI|nr:DUF6612 family protein [Salibacterium qingdaonense]SFL83752.1 hypothetical protein SAMN04488054_10657 [Salibacterium qingdaonense]
MQRILTGMYGLLIVLLLASCMSEADTDENGDSAAPSEEEPDDTEDTEPEKEPEKVMPAGDVLQQSIDKMNDIESYTISTNMNQHLELGGEQTLENRYRSNTLVNLDPVRYHESSTIEKNQTTAEETNNSFVELERYFTDRGFYMFDSSESRWVQFPEQFNEDFKSFDKSYENPGRILEMIEAYSSNIHIIEGNRHYQLTFSGGEDQTQEIALEMIGMVNTGFSSSMEDMMYMAELESLTFQLQIDKETFYPKKLKMNLDMNMNNAEGEPDASDHLVVARYSDFNETERVEIPADVLNVAEGMELDEFTGFEQMEEFDSVDGMEMEQIYGDDTTESQDDPALDFDLSEHLNDGSGGGEREDTNEQPASGDSSG